MLAMRLQRTGRKGHAQYRVVVQDSRFSPTSGRVVAYLGTFNPHTKETTIDKEKTGEFLKNGAQPSERLALLLKQEGVKLPKWVNVPAKKKASIKNAEKLRKNQPAQEADASETKADTETPEATPEVVDADTVKGSDANDVGADNTQADQSESEAAAETEAK